MWQGFADGSVRGVHGLADAPGTAFEFEFESMIVEGARQYIESRPYVRENLGHVQYCALKYLYDQERLVSSRLVIGSASVAHESCNMR